MPSWRKVITSGSNASLNALYAPSITGSLLGTASYALYAATASYATNIFISGSISDVDYINFQTGSDQPQAVGRLGWDDGYGTLNLGLKGGNVNLAVGQESVVLVYNDEATTLTDGEVVYVSGSQGNRPKVKRAIATNDGYSATTLGIVTEPIASGAEGFVTTFGMVNGLNTLGNSGGSPVWLSPTVSGAWTTTKPTAPGHTVLLGYIVRVSNTVGSIFVHISNGWELGELHDVLDTTTTSSYGDLLVKSGSIWINSKQLTGSYAITGSLTATSFTGSLFGTSSWATSALTASYATQFNVATGLTASGLIYPSADNGNESYIQTDGAGNLSLQYVKSMYETVRNRETSSIIAGIPLFVSGATGANSDVYIADASNPARMPATYIASETIAPSGTGKALISGLLTNINTTAYQAGQEFFVNTGSGITTSRPPYPNSVQLLGIITRVGVNGQAVILNPGQIEIQNIQPGYTLVGNNIGTPTAVATASLSVASASFATTASYVLQAVSASYATQALSSSYALTSSYSDTSISASYALSASYAPSTPAFPYTGSAIISGSLESTGSFKIQGAGNGFTGPFTAIEVDDVNFSRKLFDFDTGSGSLDFGARQLLDRYGTTAIEWTGTSGTYLSNLYGAHRISSGVRDKLYTNNDYSGQILLDVYFDVNVQDNDLVYLGNTGEWLQAEQNNSAATRMLGIAKEIFNQTGSVLIEGDIVVTTTGGYPVVSNAGYGSPVYIKEGTGTQMDTTVPVTGYVRLLGYCYASYNAGNEWIMKFRPSNEWVEL